jgi:hypothetical protein
MEVVAKSSWVVQVLDESLAACELQENGMGAKWSTVVKADRWWRASSAK